MEPSALQTIISTLNNHFEFLVYINASVAALFLLGYLGVKITDREVRELYSQRIRSVLFTIIITGQVVFFLALGVLYWKNYKQPAPEIPPLGDVLATTRWVKDDVRIYFIDGNQLRSVKLNGKDPRDVLVGDSSVKQYTFSPDGNYIGIITANTLYLVNRRSDTASRVDQLFAGEDQMDKRDKGEISGSIGGLQWSPDSQKFVYEMARWSSVAAQDQVYIYDVVSQSKQSIKSPIQKISSLYWGLSDGNLYYIRHEAQDTSEGKDAFKVMVYRIPMGTLKPEYVTEIPSEDFSVPIENLNFRNIRLYFEGPKYSFGRTSRKDQATSEKGEVIGIDKEDCLYVAKSQWFRKRLYKIPREIGGDDAHRYHYKGGDLVIDHIQWVPGGRYVIMEHKYWGIVVLEPSSGKLGLLIQANGHSFGWRP